MTTDVLVVQSRQGLLCKESARGSDHLPLVSTATLAAGGELTLGRERDGECWLVNKGPGTLRLTYSVPGGDEGRKRVGPRHDLVLPGQAKEIGIGRGVWWHVREAG